MAEQSQQPVLLLHLKKKNNKQTQTKNKTTKKTHQPTDALV